MLQNKKNCKPHMMPSYWMSKPVSILPNVNEKPINDASSSTALPSKNFVSNSDIDLFNKEELGNVFNKLSDKPSDKESSIVFNETSDKETSIVSNEPSDKEASIVLNETSDKETSMVGNETSDIRV